MQYYRSRQSKMSTSYLKSPTSSSTSSFSSQEHIPLNPPTLSSTSTSSTSSYSVLQGSLSSLLWRTLQHVKKKLVGDVVDDCCWYFVVCIVLKKLFLSFARELLVLLMICWCCSKMQMTGLMWSNTLVVLFARARKFCCCFYCHRYCYCYCYWCC